MGKCINALQAFDECLRIEPDDALSLFGKAKVKYLLNQTSEAIECLKKAISINPNIKKEFTDDYSEIKFSQLVKTLMRES
jgi:tetratricopeptide (TPR) repeat protein